MRGVKPERIAEWMSSGPARLAGLAERKGALAPGDDADVVVWDPDLSFDVEPAMLLHRHKVSPYLGRTLYGTVRSTFVGGRATYNTLIAINLGQRA